MGGRGLKLAVRACPDDQADERPPHVGGRGLKLPFLNLNLNLPSSARPMWAGED